MIKSLKICKRKRHCQSENVESGTVQKVGIPTVKDWKNPPRKSQRKMQQTLDAQAENVRNYLVLQRNMIPSHKHAGPVHTCVNLVDLENCCRLNLHLQKSASIQRRRNPPKFGLPATLLPGPDPGSNKQPC